MAIHSDCRFATSRRAAHCGCAKAGAAIRTIKSKMVSPKSTLAFAIQTPMLTVSLRQRRNQGATNSRRTNINMTATKIVPPHRTNKKVIGHNQLNSEESKPASSEISCAFGTRKMQANPQATREGNVKIIACVYVSQRGSTVLSGKFVLIA